MDPMMYWRNDPRAFWNLVERLARKEYLREARLLYQMGDSGPVREALLRLAREKGAEGGMRLAQQAAWEELYGGRRRPVRLPMFSVDRYGRERAHNTGRRGAAGDMRMHPWSDEQTLELERDLRLIAKAR
jgi:hypothetical protein